jgi:hypothetical protein
VGELYEPPATEASVTAEYEWLLGQYRCLVAAGFTMEPAPSLETVLDEWRAKGYGSFDPVGMAGNYGAALAACPRSTEEWPK